MDAAKIAEINGKLQGRSFRSADVFDVDGVVVRGRLLFNLIYAVAMEMEEKREYRKLFREKLELAHWGQISSYTLGLDAIDLADNNFFVGLESDRVRGIALKMARRSLGNSYPFARHLIDALHERPVEQRRLVLAITGTPEEIATPLCQLLGFDAVISTVYHTDAKGRYTTGRNLEAGLKKGSIMDQLADECRIDWEGSIGAGDSKRDIEILERVSHPLAVNPETPMQDYVRSHPKVAFISDSQKKGIHMFRADDKGRLHEVGYEDILPSDIAQVMTLSSGTIPPHC